MTLVAAIAVAASATVHAQDYLVNFNIKTNEKIIFFENSFCNIARCFLYSANVC